MAADLFSESFDAQETAKVAMNNGTGMTVTYEDYSNMTVGALVHNIPEAPRQIAGSTATRGVLMKAIYITATPANTTERIANLVALSSAGGPRLALTNNYRLKFDCYLRLSPAVTLTSFGYPNEAGTTEQMLWAVGYTAVLPVGRSFRTARGSGMWGWLATEGGIGQATSGGGDAAIYSGASTNGTLLRNIEVAADNTAYFDPAFGGTGAGTVVPHAPANQWVSVDVTVAGGLTTVYMQAVGRPGATIFSNVSPTGTGTVVGGAMVGYEDSFGSASFAPDNQWMLLDNMVVEDITPPTMVVLQTATPATFTGTPQPGTFTIQNSRSLGDLTINAINFTGTGAASYSVVTPLPLVVAPGATQTLTISFNPVAPNGVKTASMVITSDDPQVPSFTFPGISARRSVGSFFEAHYKLDETAGATAVDSSGNNVSATYQVREPLVFGKPSLLSLTDTGTSTGMLPANSGTTGNYLVSTVVHTPSFSVSMWIKPSAAVGVATRTLFQRDYDFVTTYEKICGLILTPDGNVKYRVAQTEILQSGPGGAADDEVRHIVVTHLDEDGFANTTATRSRLYINGLKVAEATANTAVPVKGFPDYPLNPTVTGMHIGSRTTAGSGFIGDMDDIQIYGVELNPHQVASMFTKPGTTAAEAELKIVGITYYAPNTTVQVTFTSLPGVKYTLQRSTNLTTWDPATVDIIGAVDSSTTVTNYSDAPAGPQFYRIKVD